MKTFLRILTFLFSVSIGLCFAQQYEMNVINLKGVYIVADKGNNHNIQMNSKYLIVRKFNHEEVIIGRALVVLVKENKCGLKIIEMVKKYKIQKGDLLREDYEAIYDEMKESDNRFSERTESWYTYWGLGYSSISYPPDIQSVLNYMKSQPGVSNVTICLDLLGFYWHITTKSIGGIIINGVGDRYFDTYGYYFQINQYNYSVSFIKYIGKYFGSGFFIRSDIGISRYVYQSNIDGNYSSEIGFGALLGGGYSFDLGGTRLLLNCNYGYRSIEQNEAGTLSFSIGGLF